MFPIRCATVGELRLQQIGDLNEKQHFTMKSFKFREAVKWMLKIFAPNYQKAHAYAKSGRTNRLAYVAVTLFYGGEKKVRENRHWKIESSITLRRYRAVLIALPCSWRYVWMCIVILFRPHSCCMNIYINTAQCKQDKHDSAQKPGTAEDLRYWAQRYTPAITVTRMLRALLSQVIT